jgi:hypothetical protein
MNHVDRAKKKNELSARDASERERARELSH